MSTNLREVGQIFLSKRLEQGLEIDDLAELLKIRRRYLESIEAGEILDMLPRVYSHGYIKTYANALNLNCTHILQLFADASINDSAKLEPIEGSSTSPGKVLIDMNEEHIADLKNSGNIIAHSTNQSDARIMALAFVIAVSIVISVYYIWENLHHPILNDIYFS